MKKILISGMLLAMGFAAMAQQNIVKEGEKKMKSGATIQEVVAVMTPAFTDPSTKDLAETYFIPGEAGFKTYDKLFGLKTFGKLEDKDKPVMCTNLIEGYEYLMKALPLDQLPDAKGKIKPKYTKKIIDHVTGHYNDFNSIAIDLWGLQDYANAYKAWDIMLNMPNQPEFKEALEKGKKVFADTILGEIYYNQALAAWQNKDFDKALQAFMNAKSKGYDKEQLYKYAVAVAQAGGFNDKLLELAKEALPKYGKEEPLYMNLIINDYLMKKDYDNAFKAIDEAIATEPNNAEYYIAKGIIYDNVVNLNASTPEEIAKNKEIRKNAIESFKKATQVNPINANAFYQTGRELCELAYILSDEAPSDAKAINEYFDKNLKPVFEDAAANLEKAYELDNQNDDTLKYLENVYYNLKDETNLKKVRTILGTN